METAVQFMSPPNPCGYLPWETAQMEYEIVSRLTPAEYNQRLIDGWRRFGHALFRPRCSSCKACRSLRVIVSEFQPDRSQRRVRKANENSIRLKIGKPSVSQAKLDLYDRFHAFQAEAKGWPEHDAKDMLGYVSSFVENPIPTQEWCFYLENHLVGVGYVDEVPGGLSAIYFFHDPAERTRSLGTWNVLSVIDEAKRRHFPFVYLGYYVDGCGSMEYKARFLPNETRGMDGHWHRFRPAV